MTTLVHGLVVSNLIGAYDHSYPSTFTPVELTVSDLQIPDKDMNILDVDFMNARLVYHFSLFASFLNRVNNFMRGSSLTSS